MFNNNRSMVNFCCLENKSIQGLQMLIHILLFITQVISLFLVTALMYCAITWWCNSLKADSSLINDIERFYGSFLYHFGIALSGHLSRPVNVREKRKDMFYCILCLLGTAWFLICDVIYKNLQNRGTHSFLLDQLFSHVCDNIYCWNCTGSDGVWSGPTIFEAP